MKGNEFGMNTVKKHSEKCFALLTVLLLLACGMIVTAFAAENSYYETAKASVPIWSEASSKSTQVRTVKKSGTVLIVTESKKNSAGNLWYHLEDGNWVYSGNVKKHSHTYPSGSGGYCAASGCGFEFVLKESSYKKILAAVKEGGTPVMNRPYADKSEQLRTASVGEKLDVVASAANARGNVWYKLSDGSWVYSKNTGKYTEPAKTAPTTKATASVETTEFVPIRDEVEVDIDDAAVTEGKLISEEPSAVEEVQQTRPTVQPTAPATQPPETTKATTPKATTAPQTQTGFAKPTSAYTQAVAEIDQAISYKDYQNQAYRKSNSKVNGICNFCTYVNILNRRLAKDGKFPKEKFDMIEVLTKVAVCEKNEISSGKISATDNNQAEHYCKNETKYWYTYPTKKKANGKDNVVTGRYGVKFKSSGGTSYTIDSASKNNGIKVDQDGTITTMLVELLKKHPEGISVCSSMANHTVAVTRYEVENGKVKFYCVDPVYIKEACAKGKNIPWNDGEIPLVNAWKANENAGAFLKPQKKGDKYTGLEIYYLK